MNCLLWKYQDAKGVLRQGTMEKYIDLGGSDHTAVMKRDTGELDYVSGRRLKEMYRVWE